LRSNRDRRLPDRWAPPRNRLTTQNAGIPPSTSAPHVPGKTYPLTCPPQPRYLFLSVRSYSHTVHLRRHARAAVTRGGGGDIRREEWRCNLVLLETPESCTPAERGVPAQQDPLEHVRPTARGLAARKGEHKNRGTLQKTRTKIAAQHPNPDTMAEMQGPCPAVIQKGYDGHSPGKRNPPSPGNRRLFSPPKTKECARMQETTISG